MNEHVRHHQHGEEAERIRRRVLPHFSAGRKHFERPPIGDHLGPGEHAPSGERGRIGQHVRRPAGIRAIRLDCVCGDVMSKENILRREHRRCRQTVSRHGREADTADDLNEKEREQKSKPRPCAIVKRHDASLPRGVLHSANHGGHPGEEAERQRRGDERRPPGTGE